MKPAVLVNSLRVAGAEKVAVTLFEEIQSRHPEAILISLETNNDQCFQHPNLHLLSKQSGSDEGPLTKILSPFSLALKLKRFVRETGITVVQSHIYRSNYVNLLARKLGSKHRTQIVNHGILSYYRGRGLKGATSQTYVRMLYPSADELICPTTGMIEDLSANGVKLPATRRIANPFDLSLIERKAAEEFMPGEFVTEPDKRYLIAVGRLERVKRFDLVIEAFGRLAEPCPDLELLILGTGPEQSRLAEAAKNTGFAARIHFLGFIANPYKYIARSELLILSSEFEGFSNVIVEALACGTCVLATDCRSGPREILAPGTGPSQAASLKAPEFAEFGALVAAVNLMQLCAAAETLLKDETAIQQYVARGTERAAAFHRTNIASEYLDTDLYASA
jgi:N-acetylgalactosamine-N,N'-diacetylbacillosaminyl-diphospho-undecaprenol 4-alpha-N-acetylgalactosaminyltransferase